MERHSRPAPYVHPAVPPGNTSPAARKYVPGQGPAPYNVPVGGGVTPPIPRLDQPHQEGMTMANQAIVQRGGGGGGAPPPSPFLPVVGHLAPAAAPGPALFATDLLPQSALTDPAFISGTGSQYASSQPALAAKHGVIRNGVLIPPQALQEGRRGLSQQTIDGIKALSEAQAASARHEAETDARVFEESAKNSAGAAARLASPSSNADVRPAAGKGSADTEVEDAIRKMDDFDFSQFREMLTRDLINNEDQRAIIEAAVTPLDISDLITQGYVLQVVPIIPGKFYPTFRSVSAGDDLALKRMLMEESGEIEANSRYLLDKFALMSVTAATFAINNNPLPEYRDTKGDFDRSLFLKKLDFILKQPFHLIAALSVHNFWFDIRVRKLFVAEKLGNG